MFKMVFFAGLVLSTMSLAASYLVPAPDDLQTANKWLEIDAKASLIGDTLSAEYCLPPDLVGTEVAPIQFTGKVKSNFAEVSGYHVHGFCMLSQQKPMACTLRYPSLVIDEASRDLALKAKYKGTELNLRERLVRLFSNDPAGLLTVDLK